MILVTGGNGNLGRAVLAELKRREFKEKIGASVRDPKKAADLAESGIEVRQGNFDDPSSLLKAFAGVKRLLIISGDAPVAVRIRQHRNAVDAANKAGVAHIVYTSFIDHDPNSPFQYAAIHDDTESYLARCGVPFTILRNGPYADLLPFFLGKVAETGKFALPAGQGKAAFITRDDIARATAMVLITDKYVGQTLEVTGEKAVSFEDIAKALSHQLGRKIRYVDSDADSFSTSLQASGLTRTLADALAGIPLAISEGRYAPTSTAVRDLTGRAPEDVFNFLARAFPPRAVAA